MPHGASYRHTQFTHVTRSWVVNGIVRFQMKSKIILATSIRNLSESDILKHAASLKPDRQRTL